MLNFIERLQKKPDKERRVIHLSLTIVLTLVIFLTWLSVQLLNPASYLENNKSESVGPIKYFLVKVDNTFSDLKEGFIVVFDYIVNVRDRNL